MVRYPDGFITLYSPSGPPDVPVPTRITGLRINGRGQDIPDEGAVHVSLPDLSPSENNVEIDYAGKPLAGLLTFQYCLLGSGTSEWSAPTKLRSVLYSNLRSGDYHFLVRTVIGRSITGPSAEVPFRVLPPVWMRSWFLISLAVLVVATAYAAHRYHVSTLLQIERMRTRIACDIHDDVGSAISKIIILSEVAQAKGAAHSLSILAQVAETGRETLDGISDLIAAINPKTDQFGDLIGRMRQFSTETFELAGIDFHLAVSDLPLERRVSPDNLRNIYLIFKECVVNVAKHSACKHVAVSIKSCQRRFILQISDDGVGFDGRPKPGRNGIANLKQRAAALKGTISWTCEHGTVVVLDIPLPDSIGWRD